jgi:ssDNA-binding Zn-finger/Zn-ribbon topoisomerase 1
MACDICDKFHRELKSAREEWAYFAYPQNKELRATSDRKSKQMANAAKKQMSEINERMNLHLRVCPDSRDH